MMTTILMVLAAAMQELAPIRGRLVDVAGNPVGGVRVECRGEGGTNFAAGLRTGPDGRFSFAPTAEGLYVVEIPEEPDPVEPTFWNGWHLSRYVPLKLTVGPGLPTDLGDLAWRRQGLIVEGRVLYRGTPAADTPVYQWIPGAFAQPAPERTDAVGRFRLKLPDADVGETLCLVAGESFGAAGRFALETFKIEQAQTTRRVEVTLRDATLRIGGISPVGRRLWVYPRHLPGRDRHGWAWSPFPPVDAAGDGRFDLGPLPEGEFLVATDPSEGPVRTAEFSTPGGELHWSADPGPACRVSINLSDVTFLGRPARKIFSKGRERHLAAYLIPTDGRVAVPFVPAAVERFTDTLPSFELRAAPGRYRAFFAEVTAYDVSGARVPGTIHPLPERFVPDPRLLLFEGGALEVRVGRPVRHRPVKDVTAEEWERLTQIPAGLIRNRFAAAFGKEP
jgi:hypothetical protein